MTTSGSSDLPAAVAGLLTRLSTVHTDLKQESRDNVTPRWAPVGSLLPEDPADALLLRATGTSTYLSDRAADMRALVTAYAQAVATRRPELAQLAAWQRISPSALRHRYTPLHVQAVRELLKPDPLIDIVLEPFITVTDNDFRGISEALDAQVKTRSRMRDIAEDAFEQLFGKDASQKLGFKQNPADQRVTRPIADLGVFLTKALETREPSLLPTFEEWTRRFAERALSSDDEAQKVTRVRRPNTSR